MKYLFIILIFVVLTSSKLLAQTGDIEVSDLDNFWRAFDACKKVSSKEEKTNIIQTLYIEKGSDGLLDFMRLRNFDAEHLAQTIIRYPGFWESVRPNTYKVMHQRDSLGYYVERFKKIYPDYKEAQVYFTISGIKSGGTTQGSKVLIGTEIAVGNRETDVSEFPDNRLEKFFATQAEDNIIPFTIHEYVHTQQKEESEFLLGQSIYEGACDFITELSLERTLNHAYLVYGRKNELFLKEKFREEMWDTDFSAWLYNGSTDVQMGDLGYFMGYAICKSYYNHSDKKKRAVKKIIELSYANKQKAKQFLKKSMYYTSE